jgi:hypothetical protein
MVEWKTSSTMPIRLVDLSTMIARFFMLSPTATPCGRGESQ